MLRLLTVALALATPASANTLTDADVQGFYAFDQKAATLLQGISNAAGASPGLRECLQSLANQFTFVVSEFKFVEAMAELEQESPADDMEVKRTLLLRAVKFLSLLLQDRKAISTTMDLPSCAGNGVVAAKGQAILRLCDEAGALVVAISKKLR